MLNITNHLRNENQNLRYHLTPVKTAIVKRPTNSKCWRGCVNRESSYTDVCMHACSAITVMANSLWPKGPYPSVPLFMGFYRQEDSSGLPCSPPGDFPHPGVEPASPAPQGDSSPLSQQESNLHCVWECKLVQPLYKTLGSFLKKLKIGLSYGPTIPPLSIYLEKWKH